MSLTRTILDWLGLVPVREQVGVLGGAAGEEPGFRRLTQGGDPWLRRDLTPLAQDYQQRLVYWLWESNPLAKWLIETTVDFTLGEGATVTSENADVREVIGAFWNDPVNRLDARLDTFAREFGLYGELCLPVAVNDVDGHVRLAYVDPLQIDQVLTHPDNALVTTAVLLKARAGEDRRLLKVIRGETDRESRNYGWLMPNEPGERDPAAGRGYDGACFLFQANRVSNAKRGRSDLLADIDWLDGYDRFLFDSMDAASLLNTYVWDVTMEGATEAQIREWLKQGNSSVKRNMVRVHNEKVKWNAVVPDLKAQDKDDYARLLRGYILGGHSFPEHWYGTSGGATFACYDETTEVLTDRGWFRFPALPVGAKIATVVPETGALEYHLPDAFHAYPYQGELIHLRNKHVDVLVTPNHRMWVKRDRNRSEAETWAIERADALMVNRFRVKQTVTWEGKEEPAFILPEVATGTRGRAVYPAVPIDMDVWLEFLGYVISDGCVLGHQHTVHIVQKKPAIVEKIRRCLARLPLTSAERVAPNGVVEWSIHDKGLAVWMRAHTGLRSRDKHLPAWCLTLSARQLGILFEALMDGDGGWDRRIGRRAGAYYTLSGQLADQVQEIAFKLGWNPKIWSGVQRSGFNKPYRPHRIYRVLLHRDDALIRAEAIQHVPYEGTVYCVEVPNHLFVTRRHGRIGIHGNTAKEMGHVPVKRLTRRQKELRQMLTDLTTFVLDQAVLHKRLPDTVKVGVVEGDPKSGVTKPTREAFRVVLPELSMRDQAAIVAALAGLTAALQQAQSQGWLRPETAARVFAGVISQLGDDINADEEFRPGTGPGGDVLKDQAQQLPRLLAQLERMGRGDGENVGKPKITTPVGGQPTAAREAAREMLRVIRGASGALLDAVAEGYPEFDPDQKRDEAGKWTEGGGTATAQVQDVADLQRNSGHEEFALSELTHADDEQQRHDFKAKVVDEVGSTLGQTHSAQQLQAFLVHAGQDAPLMDEEDRGVLGRAVAQTVVDSWAHTSSDNNPLSIAIQRAAERLFPMNGAEPLGEVNPVTSTRANGMLAAHGPVLDTALKTMYANTQREFARYGITHVTLYRGYADTEAPPSGNHTAQLRPLSSFTASPHVAESFSHGEHPTNILIAARVPVTRILSTSTTGFGCSKEDECVVLGGRFPVVAVSKSPPTRQQRGKQATWVLSMAAWNKAEQAKHDKDPSYQVQKYPTPAPEMPPDIKLGDAIQKQLPPSRMSRR